MEKFNFEDRSANQASLECGGSVVGENLSSVMSAN